MRIRHFIYTLFVSLLIYTPTTAICLDKSRDIYISGGRKLCHVAEIIKPGFPTIPPSECVYAPINIRVRIIEERGSDAHKSFHVHPVFPGNTGYDGWVYEGDLTNG